MTDYEEKIKQACEIILKLGENYELYDWHKTCIEIMDLGLSLKDLKEYATSSPQKTVLGDLAKGNFYQAANYVWNFLNWNDSMPWVMEYSLDIKDFVKAINEKV